MGKRIIRVYAHQILENKEKFLQKAADVILWNGKTYFGDILSINAENIELQGKGTVWYNRKKHTHLIPIADVREMITTVVSDW
jgi:hypothetical protein